MTDQILYCDHCGKLIPPDEAEAEDFAHLGGPPVCLACLKITDPDRAHRLATLRTTRLMNRFQAQENLSHAHPPAQVYPIPGGDPIENPTTPEMRAIRAELAADWPAKAGPAAPGNLAEALPPGAAELPLITRRALWAMLACSLFLIVGLLLLTPYLTGDAGPAQPAEREAQVPRAAPDGPLVTAPDTISPTPAPRRSGATQGLAEIEILETLTGRNPDATAAQLAIEKLKLLAAAGRDPERQAASRLQAYYLAHLDGLARQAARDAAEGAQDLAGRELFALAEERLARAVEALPAASPWAVQRGRERLEALQGEIRSGREQAKAEYTRRFETQLAEDRMVEAQATVEALARHPEAVLRDLAAPLRLRVTQAKSDHEADRQRREEEILRVWTVFFRQWDAALAAGDSAAALELTRTPLDSPLLRGGPEEPKVVLAGFAAEAASLRALYDAVLELARSAGTRPPQKIAVGAVEGILEKAEGRALVLRLPGKAQMQVGVEALSPDELGLLVDEAHAGARFRPALWTLRYCRSTPGEERNAWLARQFAPAALPLHWERRFALLNQQALKADLARRLELLHKAKESGDKSALGEALAGLRALPPQAQIYLTPEVRALMSAPERAPGKRVRKRLVFQNGSQPAADYVGIRIDQINRYYKNAERTDADVQHGLKAGSYNDLQRVLLRFDGLESALGQARLIKATLELYQIASPKAEGAGVGIYRLQKTWTPGAGTWTNADQRRKVAWQRPGASGPEDVAVRADAEQTLDKQSGLWRSWDLTAYCSDFLAGKSPNTGLLLRVVNNEPAFDVRFYPNTELQGGADATLRPRLVVEAEVGE